MSASGLIYFVRPGNTDFVKIGWTSNFASRMNVMQTHNPHPINLLRAIEGDKSREKRIHQMFARHRTQGEWYALAADILAFIEQSAADHVDPYTYDDLRFIAGVSARLEITRLQDASYD